MKIYIRKKQIKSIILCAFVYAILFMLSSCTPTVNSTKKDNTLADPSAPYSKKIGSVYNTYIFHNFIGEEPDIIPSTAKADVNRYLEQGVSYLQSQFDDFYESVSDRAGVKRYFAQFNIDFSDVPKIRQGHYSRERSDCEKMDYFVNKISEVCEPVMTEILNNLPKNEHDAMVLCYRVFANQAYREGLGNKRKSNNKMMDKYNQERADISVLWEVNNFLKSISLENDLDHRLESRRCARTADRVYTLLHDAANKMQQSNPILEDINMKDLQYFITLALNASSLAAMHDFTEELLKHDEEGCTLNVKILP